MNRTRLILLVLGTLSAFVLAGLAVAVLSRPAALPSASGLTPASAAPPERRSAEPVPETTTTEPVDGGAAPFVQTFAAQPGVAPLPRLPSPTTTQSMPAFADGCDHAYGDRSQCVPLTFPADTTDKCAWLSDHGFGVVAVVGKDRHGLDPDGDKIACNN